MKKAIAAVLLFTCLYLNAPAQTDSPHTVQTATTTANVDSTTKTVTKPAQLQAPVVAAKSDSSSARSAVAAAPAKVASDWMTLVLVFIPVIVFLGAFLVFRKELGQIKLSEALSENETSKVTVKNDQYKIEEIKELIAKLSSGGGAAGSGNNESSKTEANNSAVKATKERVTAEALLANATTAAAADTSNPALSAAVADAQSSLASKKTAEEAALKSLNQLNEGSQGNVISAAMLMNLATLFPPTIEVSGGADHASSLTEDNRKYRPSSSRIVAFMAGILTLVLALSMTCFFIFFYCTTGTGPDLSKLFAVIVALGLGMAPYAVNKISGVVGSQKSDS